MDTGGLEHVHKNMTGEEAQTVETLRSRRMIREGPFDTDIFTLDTIDGLAPRLERGKPGLAKAERARLDTSHSYSPPFLDGEGSGYSGEQRPPGGAVRTGCAL